jgi:hypothetical protein
MKPLTKRRLGRIKTAITNKPYIFYFISVFIIYITINIIINKFYETTDVFTTLATWFVIPFLFFSFLLIPFLVALTVSLIVLRIKESGIGSKVGSVATAGVFGGLLAGACPGCFVGLFPAFLGLFGLTASLSVLPLYGIELQVLSVIFLIFSIYLLTKDMVCETPIKTKK